jgi:glutaredoxin
MDKRIDKGIDKGIDDIIEFTKPYENIYTIYSKSGCPNCKKVKILLEENNIEFIIVDCDEYLINYKTEFLQFIKNLISKECKMFPMVFDNKCFIGGFSDTEDYLSFCMNF